MSGRVSVREYRKPSTKYDRSHNKRSMKKMMRKLIVMMLAIAGILGCAQRPPISVTKQGVTRETPTLPERQQELILARAVELMQESGHWQGYPLESLGFDKERRQWRLLFSDSKPDSGYAVFIESENATGIDILLFPPMWTKYERQNASNKAAQGSAHP